MVFYVLRHCRNLPLYYTINSYASILTKVRHIFSEETIYDSHTCPYQAPCIRILTCASSHPRTNETFMTQECKSHHLHHGNLIQVLQSYLGSHLSESKISKVVILTGCICMAQLIAIYQPSFFS